MALGSSRSTAPGRRPAVASIDRGEEHGMTSPSPYAFAGGYPTPETVRRAYDELDLNRALQLYRVFYPTVSGAAIFAGNARVGVVPNTSFGTLDTQPKHVGYTLNSDTPYGGVLLDLSAGPLVIELPPGPLLGAAVDINQRWVADLGLPGRTPAAAASTSSCRPATRGPSPPATTSAGPPRTA